jgi:hypothetical protein
MGLRKMRHKFYITERGWGRRKNERNFGIEIGEIAWEKKRFEEMRFLWAAGLDAAAEYP